MLSTTNQPLRGCALEISFTNSQNRLDDSSHQRFKSATPINLQFSHWENKFLLHFNIHN